MRFTEYLIEQAEFKIGVTVYNPSDVKNMDFQVFAWPDPDNTVADQSRKLEKSLPNDDDAAHSAFYKKLQSKGKPQKKDGEMVFGPFNSIDELM